MPDGLKALREGLEARLGSDEFRTWFTGVSFAREGDKLVVLAPTDFTARGLRSHLKAVIEAEARQALGEGVTVEISSPTAEVPVSRPQA